MKLVCNIGINDADYVVKPTVKGVRMDCPIYSKWFQMLQRCYSEYGLKRNPSYVGCSVCEEWHRFSNYRDWYLKNYSEGLHLDKDILVKGNKLYSPETCCFVPRYINNTLLCKHSTKGEYPIGVYFEKESGKYKAQSNVNGKYTNLGRFNDPQQAHQVWQKQKIKNLSSDLNKYSTENCFNTKVAEAIMGRIWDIQTDLLLGKETICL